jgi:hypothetical protein
MREMKIVSLPVAFYLTISWDSNTRSANGYNYYGKS